MNILESLTNTDARDAHRLTEAAINIVAYGSMFSPAAAKSAAEYVRLQADKALHPSVEEEKKVLLAIAEYFEAASK